MQSRDKVNNIENLNKAMIQRTKDSCVCILHKNLCCFFRICRDGSAQLFSYLHGRGLRSVPADVAEGAVGVFLRVVGAWLAERIWRLGDSFSATPGPTDWERAEHAIGWFDFGFRYILVLRSVFVKVFRYDSLSLSL